MKPRGSDESDPRGFASATSDQGGHTPPTKEGMPSVAEAAEPNRERVLSVEAKTRTRFSVSTGRFSGLWGSSTALAATCPILGSGAAFFSCQSKNEDMRSER